VRFEVSIVWVAAVEVNQITWFFEFGKRFQVVSRIAWSILNRTPCLNRSEYADCNEQTCQP
jgi:hypothetical protein